jgi:hypothetical protein
MVMLYSIYKNANAMRTKSTIQTIKSAYLAIRIVFATLGGVHFASAQNTAKGPEASVFITDGNTNVVDKAGVENILKSWPSSSASMAKGFLATYGLPAEIKPLMMIWKGQGPWEQIIVYKEALTHEFPKKHSDVVEQTIRLQIPQDKMKEVSDFARGCGILIYHSRGEISSCCDLEAANVLAFNLAFEIVNGTKTAAEAKAAYAENMKDLLKGNFSAYTQQKLFVPSQMAKN